MGLDMYLKAEKYVGGWKHSPAEDRDKFAKLLTTVGLSPEDIASDSPSATLTVTVGYWRKANAIHKWFIDNVQGGKDECDTSDVSREQLGKLLELCKQCKETHDATLLPPCSGFFFGSTEIDEYYWQDIDLTIEILGRVLSNERLDDWDFSYRSSW